MAVAVVLPGTVGLSAMAQQRPVSALHGVWHGTIKDDSGKIWPKLQIEVSPDTGCHLMTISPGTPGKYQTVGCRVAYLDKFVTLEIPQRWSLSLKLEGDALVGIYVEGNAAGRRHNITMTRGPWTD